MIEILVRAIVEIVASIELSDDEVINPDTASALLGDMVAILDGLSDDDRFRVAEIIRVVAATERDSRRRSVMLDLPEGLGLIDE